MSAHTRYLVTPQGNCNLALDYRTGEIDWFRNIADADAEAVDRARSTRQPQYVHEVTVRALRQHSPVTTVKSTDMLG